MSRSAWRLSQGRIPVCGKVSGLLEGVLSLLDDRRESGGFPDRQIGKDLAVDLDPGALHAGDKLGIGQAVLAGTGIDALDPQTAEIALLGATIAIRVLKALFDLLQSDAVVVIGAAPVALGELEDLLVPCVRCNTALCTCHVSIPLLQAVREEELDDLTRVDIGHDTVATRLALHVLRT